ncbi:MAG: alpha-2-macroglobulin family protein, partial [Bacteroidota bacterium]
QDVVNVTMKPDVCALEEVVVTAMGVSRESAVLYCMAETVSTTSISGIPGAEAGLTSTLSGKVAGVQITRAGASGDMVAITIRGAGTTKFEKEPLYIIDGVVYAGDIGEVDPNLIRNIQILKGEEGTALYGSRAIHGVVLITTGGDFKPASPLASMGAGYDEAFLEAASQASSIRNNFSDQAFWQPTLITDEDGAASFKVTFPDDVTSWRTFYLAMNGHKQTGQAEGVIKSYKPLMAQLAVPRFLMEGDTTYAIGKVLNYTTDSVSVHTKFELNGQLIADTAQTCIRSLLDTLELTTTSTDSLTVKYYLEKADGYFDGEQREIPVFPVGLEETAGQFHVLQGDTSIMLNLSGIAGAGNRGKIKDENMEVTLYARADVLEVMGVEISRLINYKYSCNEQLASKLKALLAEQQIADYKNERFKRERQVEKVIRLLIRNQIENGLWGWWKSSGEASLWISTHVLEALVQAREMDYRVNLDVGNIAEMLTWELEKPIHADRQLRILKILNMMEAQVSYPAYLERIRGTGTLNMNQLFRLMELEQMRGLETDTDTLFEYRKETMFGNLYFSDDSVSRWFYTNEIQNTLTAYRILRTDSTEDHSGELQRIRNYIFEQRSRGGWLNTFESAKILETILPDMLVGGKELVKPVITFSGALDQTVEEFPFEAKVSPGDTIEVEKRGDFPVYLTTYVRYWNPAPLDKRSDFEISTHFSGIEDNRLKGGEPAEMIVHVKVLKDADYVMVNVPIPAGCSYGDKSARSRHEVHREYFRNETAIFCENLEAGNYRFTINLIPRYSGSYTVNPARVEMMYFPTFNANNGIRHISVR